MAPQSCNHFRFLDFIIVNEADCPHRLTEEPMLLWVLRSIPIVGNLTSIPAIRVALGLFTGFPGFVGFTGITDGIPCAPILTLGLLVFTRSSGEGLLGLISWDLLGML